MTTGRLGTHALPPMLLLPFFAACFSLLANGCYADKPTKQTEERSFNVVATYRTSKRGTGNNDVILTDRGLHDDIAAPDGLHRGVRQANTQNEVESLFVLDRVGFERFLSRNNNNDTAAREEVTGYFAGLVKSVNARLQNLDTGGFSVRLILLEILILTGNQSAVTDDLDQDNDGQIDADSALNRFLTLSNTLEVLNPHDYALLVTGYDIIRANGDDPLGIAFQNGVCSSNKQGLVEDGGNEFTSYSIAHQVGHTLGARHDQFQNSCPDASFTMSATATVPLLRSESGNPFTYSDCSGSEIRTFLVSQFTDCLRSRQTTAGSEVDIAALTTVPLGQQYNADQQCRNAYGSTSKFCRSLYNSNIFTFDGDMCYNLRCLLPQGSCEGILAFNGTTCADGKWCVEGSCVADLEAPATPSATCPQGDDPTADCSTNSCAIEQLRLFQCCATCASGPSPTSGPVSVAGTQTTAPMTPPGGATLSIFGVTSGPGPGPATLSIDGLQPGTPTGPGPAPTLSIDGVQPQTATPAPGATLSIYGAAPPAGPTLSIYGAQPGPTTGPTGPTLSVYGVQPGPTPGPVGPTLSVEGAGPGPVGPTLSIDGAGPITPGPVGPTLSVAGPAPPTTAGISVGPPATPQSPTVSVPGPGVVAGI